MKRLRPFLFIIWLCVLLLTPLDVFAGSMTLTTYYPAPFGAYAKMRLVPKAAEGVGCQTGSMYVNGDIGDLLQYCHSSGDWGYLPGVWTQAPGTDQVVLTDLGNNPAMKVGIGTNNPTTQLHIANDSDKATILMERVGGTDLLLAADQSVSIIGSSNNTGLEFRTDNTARIYVSGDGRVGINKTNPDDHDLEINGQVEISIAAGSDSKIKMTSGGVDYAMGIDSTDGFFTISPGADISTAGVYIKLTNTGVIINGPLQIKKGSDPLGEIKLKYIEAGAQSGYYSLYAP